MLTSLVASWRDLTRVLRQPLAKRGSRRRVSAIARYAEFAETRVLLSTHSLAPVADGVVADRDLDGLFEFSETSASSVTNRWFDSGGIGQERGVLEFDLGQFAPGSIVTSVKLGIYVTSFTAGATNGPTLAFSVKSGDGNITATDGDGAGVSAGTASVSNTGYREFSLTASAFASLAGGKVSVRVSNSVLNGHWISAASSEDTSFADPVLIVDVAAPTLSVAVNPNALNEDGSVSAVGTVTRTGDMSQALTVTLSNSDSTEISIPASVVIPIGASSAQFDVAAVDDVILDGTQTATITASATINQATAFGADTTFGTNGISPTRAFTAIQPSHGAVMPLSDGKYLIASEVSGGTSWQLLRYNANGSLDTTFGSNGIALTAFGGTLSYPVPRRIVVQPDGKILVGGKFSSGTGSAVLTRHNANGTIDTTFGNAGKADLANLGAWIEDIALRPDGRILLAASFNGTSYFRVAGLTSTGQFDSNFGVKTYTTINGLAKAIELLDDGSFILAGGKFVAKFTAAGVLDTSYGTNGIRNIGLPTPEFTEIFDAKLGTDGKLSLGIARYNNATQTTNNTANMAALRLTANGDVDTTFGNGAIQSIDFNGMDDVPITMLLQSDGKILIGGYTEVADNNRDMAMVRFNVDGTLDTTFDGDGRFRQNVITYTGEMIASLAQQADGKLIALAGFSNDYRLLRYHSGIGNLSPQGSTSVTVLDNENAMPVVDARTFQIPENSSSGDLLGQIVAHDPDAGQSLTFSITGSSLPGAFAIDSTSGELFVADGSLLNYEAVTTVTLTVTATDNGTPNQSGSNAITVHLTNVNESPTIQDQTFSIAENSAAGTIVATVAASDADAGQSLTYAISESSLPGAFVIDSGMGRITVSDASLLNFESITSAELTVVVSDSANPSLSAPATITVNITNVNEAPVVSDATFSIREYLNSGLTVGQVVASNQDAGQTLRYSIVSQSVSEAFMIRMDTGEIIVWHPAVLDYETVQSITVTVRATDNANPTLSSTATVIVSITDVNESPVMGAQSFTVGENAENGTVVGSISGEDVDQGQSLTWTISSSPVPGAFAVNAATGELTVANGSLLNFESRTSIELGVFLTDNGTPVLATVAPITINITNINEAPSVPNRSFTVDEDSLINTAVGSAAGTDPDASQSLSYAISSTTLPGAFAINAATGQLTVANQSLLNFEAVTNATLVVTATDNGNPALQGSGTITINLRNLNEAPVVLDQTFSIDENTTNGTMVGLVAASEVDAGQSLTYSIVSGNTAGPFAINSSTGQITVANSAALDFETSPVFLVTVRVADNGSPSLSRDAVVTINLNNVNEAIAVLLDVVPGDSTNTFRRTAKFEIAVLSTVSFDARNVLVGSVRFGKLGTEDSIVRDKKGNRLYSYRDVNGDGRLDLVFQIDGSKTGLAVGDTLARLTADLLDGTDLFGSSSVVVKR